MNSSQLKRVLEEGLHHDHTTDGEYHNSEIKQSLDIRKFLHEPMANVLKKKQSRKPLKSIQPTVINGSTMKTRILVLKHQLTVKYLIFWLGGQLLVEKKKNNNNNQPYSKPPEKDLEKPSHHIENCHLLDPPVPSEFSLPSVGRVWLFSGTTQFMYYSRGKDRWWKVESWLNYNWDSLD